MSAHAEFCECASCDEVNGFERCGFLGCRNVVMHNPDFPARPIRPCWDCKWNMEMGRTLSASDRRKNEDAKRST